MSKKQPSPILASQRAIRKLGGDIRSARIRRRITSASLAERIGASPRTVVRLEQGDSGVGIGYYANALTVLGLVKGLADAAAPENDVLGQRIAEDDLPQRVRPPRRDGS